MTKMMIQNLSPSTTEESLRSLFAEFGNVQSVALTRDIMTGRCGGLGFVRLDELSTGAALDALDGKCVAGRVLKVTYEKKRDPQNLLAGS